MKTISRETRPKAAEAQAIVQRQETIYRQNSKHQYLAYLSMHQAVRQLANLPTDSAHLQDQITEAMRAIKGAHGAYGKLAERIINRAQEAAK